MEVYKVLVAFTDLQDDDKIYRKNDYYVSSDSERAGELESTENKRKTALIKKLTKKELLALADEKGIEVNSKSKVDELHKSVGGGLNG